MRRILGIVLTVVSSLLICAHFLRAGWYPLILPGLAFPLLLLFRKTWATRIVQVLLVLAAAEWIRTLVMIAGQRRANGEPWTRMAIILGFVALVTAASALVLKVERRPPGQPFC